MSEPYVGEIRLFPFDFAPQGWAKCDGQLLHIVNHQALFSLIGNKYGGDGQVTFALPDLRGRVPMHQGTGPGLSERTLGQSLGEESVALTEDQLPPHAHELEPHTHPLEPHTHTANASTRGKQDSPTDGIWSTPGGSFNSHSDVASINTKLADIAISSSGDGNTGEGGTGYTRKLGNDIKHNNIPPSLVFNFCIALKGIYPSRN